MRYQEILKEIEAGDLVVFVFTTERKIKCLVDQYDLDKFLEPNQMVSSRKGGYDLVVNGSSLSDEAFQKAIDELDD